MSFYINQEYYTEEELIKMIHYYKINVLEPSKIPPLNNDVMREIMLRMTSNSIKNMALVNKVTNHIALTFWKDKLKFDNLPQLLTTIPTTIGKHLEYYKDILFYNCSVIKLLNNIILTKTFTKFSTDFKGNSLLKFPTSITKHLDLNERAFILFEITIDKDVQYYLQLNTFVDQFILKENIFDPIEFTRKEFILYLTTILYSNKDDHHFSLSSTGDKYILIKDFKSNRIKRYFPNW